MKLCIAAHFESRDYFQWYIVLDKIAKKMGISVSKINCGPVFKKMHSNFKTDSYWQPLREADLVYVYATRRPTRQDVSAISWWTLPQFVKPFMKEGAKMLAQWDDEFLWLFNPNGMWWDLSVMPNPLNHGGPEKFFKDTGILEIPDGHIVVTNNPPYEKYTKKPVFKIPLPHLCRYKLYKYSENHIGKNIAMMLHSPKSSSIEGTLENVIRAKGYAVTIYNGSLNRELVQRFRQTHKLPPNSGIMERMEYEPYADLLWRNNMIGLDDNADYGGWSRFGMECAVTCIPCVGSSNSVHDLFPELYTKLNDYAKQIELIERLRTDKKFYHEMVEVGRKRVLEIFDEEKLCKMMLDAFDKVGSSKNIVVPDTASLFDPLYKPDKHQAHPHP